MVLTIGSLSGPATASTLRVRVDRNDSPSKLDIHKVITNLSDTTMYLRLRSWDRFRIGHTNDENWKFLLDTFGTRRFDRWSRSSMACMALFAWWRPGTDA
jgi:hypothetical protein